MKIAIRTNTVTKILASISLALLSACQVPTAAVSHPIYGSTNLAPTGIPRTYCSIIGLRPEKEVQYRKLHANVWPKVRTAIQKAHIKNYNIYIARIDGKKYLISHFEYVGNNPEKDFASIAKDPTTKLEWWPVIDACELVLKGTPPGHQWLRLERVMHID